MVRGSSNGERPMIVVHQRCRHCGIELTPARSSFPGLGAGLFVPDPPVCRRCRQLVGKAGVVTDASGPVVTAQTMAPVRDEAWAIAAKAAVEAQVADEMRRRWSRNPEDRPS